MSTIPARTRSLRKANAESGRYEKSVVDTPAETPRERGNVSPSRLPKPPSSVIAGSSSSRSTNVSRPTTSSSTSTGTGHGSSIRPASQRTGISRPPLTSDNKTYSHRSGARTPTEPNSSLQRAPSTRHSRNSSTSALPARPSSSSGNPTRSNIFPPSASTLIRPPSSASTTSTHPDSKISQRPAFSTLQQHFSPARSIAAKPLTSHILAPPSPSKQPAAIAASAEIARLQAELLQLHLLHRCAAPTLAQYQSSARAKLKARFEDVRAKHEELVELEAIDADKTNARALRAWADSEGDRNHVSAIGTTAAINAVPGWGLDEKIQTLDQVLSAAWKLSEPSGRYARLVKRFERWLSSVSDILEARKQPLGSVESVHFVEELDAEWQAELQSVARKVEQWRTQLRDLGDVPSSRVRGGSVARVLSGVRALVQGMRDEVAAMERLQRVVALAEEEWIREAIGEDGDEELDLNKRGDSAEGSDTDVDVVGAVWRRTKWG